MFGHQWPTSIISSLLIHVSFVALVFPVDFPAVESVSGPHIAELNVLLPPRMTNPVYYRLQGSDGCFSWAWDHHDILQVEPEYNGTNLCSMSARLISIAPYSGRKETSVYATDVRTGFVIRCEVFIDKIVRVKTFHHSVKLDLDGIATLRALAFDNEDNVFSSLVGVRFKWQLFPKSIDTGHHSHFLRNIPLRDTPLSDCGGFCGDINAQIQLEDSGVASDLYVVKGVAIGQEVVSVHLFEPEFEHIEDSLVLTVAEAISLDPPSPTYVLIGSQVQYSLKVLRQHVYQVVALPSPYHRWYAENTSVVRIDAKLGLTSAVDFGTTIVFVEDTRVVGNVQLSTIHVVLPDKLVLYIQPVSLSRVPVDGTKAIASSDCWYLTIGHDYVVHAKLFSHESGSQAIHIAGNEAVDLTYNHTGNWINFWMPTSIGLKYGWQNCVHINAVSEGMGRLEASFGFKDGYLGGPIVLHVMQEVMVCDQVKIHLDDFYDQSRTIRLPWAVGVYQDFQLKATGGCGSKPNDYTWHSSDSTIVSLSAVGYALSKSPGQALVTVTSVFDPLNYDKVFIEVSFPSYMVMLQNLPVEAVVGSYLAAAITLKTANGSYYHQCNAFASFTNWHVLGEADSFKIVNTTGDLHAIGKPDQDSLKSDYGPACGWAYLYAQNKGRAALHVSILKDVYANDLSTLHTLPTLRASKFVAAYNGLAAYQAGDGNRFGGYKAKLAGIPCAHCINEESLKDLYLVPETSINLLLADGPARWDDEIQFVDSLEITAVDHSPADGILVKQTSAASDTTYSVFCKKLGAFELVFKRGNLVGKDHPLPALSIRKISIVCSFPSSITLIANEPDNTPDVIRLAFHEDRNAGRVWATPVTVPNSCTIRLAAVGIHNNGIPFVNCSSLSLNWELKNCEGLAKWERSVKGSERSISAWERFLVLHNVSGLCLVRATVLGVPDVKAISSSYEASPLLKTTTHMLTDAVRLQLVTAVRVYPEFQLLFFHPQAKENISIFGGTGDIVYAVDTANIIEVQQSADAKCVNLTIGARELGSAVITVQDIGLAVPVSSSALVVVSDIEWVEILSVEEIRLEVGTSKSFDIVAGSHGGHVFPQSQYALMKLQLHFHDEVLELLDKDGFSVPAVSGVCEPKFTIRALGLGFTPLHVTAIRGSGDQVSSKTIHVEIYSPLSIHPDDIFLAPGASYVLMVSGGPRKGTRIEYSSLNVSTVSVDRFSGRLLAASLGNTILRAGAYDNAGALICEASAKVTVGIPSSMRINLPSGRLGVHRQMPVYPVAFEGDLLAFYEVCTTFKWITDNDQVLSLHKVSENNHQSKFISNQNLKMNSLVPESFSEPIITLYGRSVGEAGFSVSFSCDFVLSGGIKQSVFYNMSETIQIVADPPLALGLPATWLLPPFYTTSSILPRAATARPLKQKGGIIYTPLTACNLRTDIAQAVPFIIDGGNLKTFNVNVVGCIQATDQATQRTEIASCVKVAEVTQVQIHKEQLPYHRVDLPLGALLQLGVGYKDDLGAPFLEANGVVPLSVATNRRDILSTQISSNGTLVLQGINNGKALVRISISNGPHKADYMLVSVGESVFPRNQVLHIGDTHNFKVAEGKGSHNESTAGQWFSRNSSVISIMKDSGKAIALNEGITEVLCKSEGMEMHTAVTVLERSSVTVEPPAETLTNVPFPVKGYKFLIRIRSSEDFEESNTPLYDCSVDPPYIGYAKPWRDSDTRNSYCLFFPYSPEYFARTFPELTDGKHELKGGRTDKFAPLVFSVLYRGKNNLTGSAHALFCAGFSILGSPKLHLNPDMNKSQITIVGNTDVQVHWNSQDIMAVKVLSVNDIWLSGKAVYEVQVTRDVKFKDMIVFLLPSTGQREVVEVSYESREGTNGSTSIRRDVLVFAIIFSVAALAITILIFIKLHDRPIGSVHGQALSAHTDPITPVCTQSSPVGDIHTPIRSTPRTPEPFTEYLRKTINETPHLRRGGRRIDPQYTY